MTLMRLLFLVTFLLSHSLQADMLGDILAETNATIEETPHEKKYYQSDKKEHLLKKITYGQYHNILLKEEFNPETGKLKESQERLYKANQTKKTRPIGVVIKTYDGQGLLSEYRKKIIKKPKDTRTTRQHIKNYTHGILKTESETLWDKTKIYKWYKSGKIETKRVEEGNTYQEEQFKNGRLTTQTYARKNYDYNGKDFKEKVIHYAKDGSIKRTDYYDEEGIATYRSNCTNPKIETALVHLENKYDTRTEQYQKTQVSCYTLKNGNHSVIASYYDKTKGNIALWIVTVNPAKGEAEQNIFTVLKDNEESLERFKIALKTYKSLTTKNTFDVIPAEETNENHVYYTYRIKANKIIRLQSPTFDLQAIEKSVKQGGKLTTSLLASMLFETPLNKTTLEQYNNIGYYLQKNGANKAAVYLLEQIVEIFPERTVAYYNLGDAYWAIGFKALAKEQYRIYKSKIDARNQDGKQRKIPQDIKEKLKT